MVIQTKSKMNQKTYSILFCALLASTFVHEIRAKAAAQPASLTSHLQERVADLEVCEVICEGGGGPSGNVTIELNILVNAEANVLVIGNLKFNYAILIDFNVGLVALLNGNTGAAIIINLKASSGVYIKGDVWLVKKISLKDYVATTLKNGLKFLLDISGAVSFKLESISSAILKIFNEIISKLLVNIDVELEVNEKAGIDLIVAISTGLVTVFTGSLKGMLTIIGSGVITIKQDLAGFLNSLQGLSILIVKIFGDLGALIKAGVKLDLALLSLLLGKASSGLDILGNLVLIIGGKIDLKILGDLLNDAENFFKFVAQLGGNINIGLTGIFKVVAQIILLIKGKASLDVVIGVIMQYLAANGQSNNEDIEAQFKASLNIVLKVLEKINATEALAGLVTTIKALLAGNLTINGVSISAIINLLIAAATKSGKSLLQVLVAVLLELKAVIEVAVSMPTLFFVLMININSAIGIQLLKALGITIEISIKGIVGGIFSSILKSVPSLIRLFFGDLYGGLKALPVIGKILEDVNAALSAASNGKLSLKTLLNASALISGLIKGVLQIFSGVYLGVSKSDTSKAESAVKTCTSTSFYYSVNASVTIG